ncbi:endo-1,4-beta-xylanase [uncultured Duncaniella sp.]|uniref:endo-1,4-beta-xylanase n=1 Tax=uncultured Duncaniella sp. TaxID=2768039 RepID=UPI00260D065D|nr:endo-1,4-beta-xylanase [uncultured Duncaniella sp.]
MKTNHKLWLAFLAGASLTGCADQEIDNYYVEKPASIAQYEYLNAYGNLKDYLRQRTGINPDFKLGVGVAASDYNKFGQVYRITNANFDQITAGNAMKYASVVKDNGEMDFSTVTAFVEAAEKAGIEVYGHTLCWHEQQNVKWLNGLIADKELDVDPDAKNEIEEAVKDFKNDAKFPFYVMGYEPEIINGILTDPEYPGDWYQFFIMDGLSTVPGRAYKVTAKIRGSKAGELNAQFGNWGAMVEKKMSFTDEWSECSVEFDGVTTESSFVVFQPGTYDGKLEIEWVKLSHTEAPAVEVETEVRVKTYEDGPFPFYAMGCEPPVINGCIHFVPTGDWSQFFILPGGENHLDEGDYVLYLDITASKEASGVQLTMQNGWGGDAQALSVPVMISEGHNNVRLNFSGITGGDYDVILKPQTTDATLDVRSVTVCKVEKLNKIPVSPEEKAEILTNEMERWVKGMMEATAGKVKAWDVVNEAISGGPWGQRYDLQHAATASGDQSNKFYWQDYLGDNFVRVPVKFARQYFAENGGNPEELKLFINDYNLESDWDDNQKLKSLISWIEQWESDGVTKIDGIGSQMHITCYMNPETQASKEAHVVKMLELMAASGKLVRITELDMGLCDENGNTVKTEDQTFEQKQAMAAYYKFVIEKYFEIIPPAQQYGICQWAQTDSPEGSGWRPGEPIGLWDSNYSRKPAYGGFAEGLAGGK